MPALRFRLVNVFTRAGGSLTGNPLCVFEDGSGLDTRTMQALALQFNLSETTFLLPASRAAARVRIFTPDYEMPFAGHPTLGSAHVCRAMGLGGDCIDLQMESGIVPVRAAGARWTLSAPGQPQWCEPSTVGDDLARCLGLGAADLGRRPLRVSTGGNEQLIVPVSSAAAVRRAAPPPALFAGLENDRGRTNALVFAIEGNHLLARYFFAQAGSVREDPATGSAAANLGGWWLAMGGELPAALVIEQGEQTGRPSTLYLDITASCVEVGGDVIEIGAGILDLS